MPEGFKICCTFKDEITLADGSVVNSLNIGVTKNAAIRTAADAEKHCQKIIGVDPDGNDVTLIHHKNNETGEFVSIVKADAVIPGAVSQIELPKIMSIQAGPPQPTK